MLKKLLLLIALLLLPSSAFTLDKKELNLDFFTKFNDEYLVYYIDSALENNHDLKKAGSVVEQYRQQTKYSFGKELPSFSVGADYLGIKVPRLDNFRLSKSAFILPFMVNYEADFFLKNRDKTKSVKKSYEASKYNEKAIYIALLTDVATVYTNILQYDELIQKQEKSVKLLQDILNSDTKKFERGIINSTQLNNSKKNLETEKNTFENLQKEREISLMQLAVLTGSSAVNIKDMKRGSLKTFEYSETIPNEIPSDVIFARPDVMVAETNLEKAQIDIRVARKEFLPTFNITGLWAFNTIAPGAFFSWESSVAMLLAGATQDIFKGGMKIANLRIQKAKYEELFEEYRQTDLEAVKEVNTSLCFIKHDTDIEKNTTAQLNYEMANFNSSQKKLNQGVISQPEYLNEENKLLSLEKTYSQAKTQRIINYFTLYKVVGGQL